MKEKRQGREGEEEEGGKSELNILGRIGANTSFSGCFLTYGKHKFSGISVSPIHSRAY